MPEHCIRYYVSGRVQGVFFRDATRRQAMALGLRGYARNLPDGRVEVVACGAPEAVDQLRQWLRQGPPQAIVDAVSPERADDPQVTGFEVR